MEKVFVTGGSGFIGAVLVKKLLDKGIQVAVLKRSTSQGRRLTKIADKLTYITSQDGTTAALRRKLRQWKPDTIFHLGWSGVGNAYRNEASVQLQNIEVATDLAQMCDECGVEHFIGSGSQAEYGQMNRETYETERPSPTTLYGGAKLATGILTERICAAQAVRHAWIRLFSIYGPDDNPDWMIPSLIQQLLAGKKPSLTACEQIWDYLYVDDAADAFVAVGHARAEGFFNLGSGKPVRLRKIVELIRDLIAPSLPIGFGDIPYRNDQVMHLQASIERLSLLTKWKPTVSLEEGLTKTIRCMSESAAGSP